MRTESLIPFLVAVILVVVGYIAWYITRKRRSQKLREKFPPNILALDGNVTDRYDRQWTKIQTAFGNDPSQSVDDANRLIKEVMIARGFPVADYEQDAADLSVIGPSFVSNYRSANGHRVEEPAQRDLNCRTLSGNGLLPFPV